MMKKVQYFFFSLFLLVSCAPQGEFSSPPFRRADVEEKVIALTFDDGPHPVHTPRLLKILKEQKVKATFFVLGQNVNRFPKIVRQIMEEGHEIGSHTYSHSNLTHLSSREAMQEIRRGNEAIEKITGKIPSLFRPPYAALTPSQRNQVRRLNMRLIFWNLDPLDWKDRDENIVYQRIVDGVSAGDIVLAHDIHQTTIDAFPRILRHLKRDGWRFLTVSELMNR